LTSRTIFYSSSSHLRSSSTPFFLVFAIVVCGPTDAVLTIAPIFSHLSLSNTTVYRFCDTSAFIRKAGSLRKARWTPHESGTFFQVPLWPPPVVLIGNFIVTLGLCELRFLHYERTAKDAAMCSNAPVTGSH